MLKSEMGNNSIATYHNHERERNREREREGGRENMGERIWERENFFAKTDNINYMSTLHQ